MRLTRITLLILAVAFTGAAAIADTVDRVQFKASGLAFVWNSAGQSQRVTAKGDTLLRHLTGTLEQVTPQTLQLGGADARFAIASNAGFVVEAQLVDPLEASVDASFTLRAVAGPKAHAPTAASMQRISVRELVTGTAIYTSAHRTAARAGSPEQQAIQFELVPDFGDRALPEISITVRVLQ